MALSITVTGGGALSTPLTSRISVEQASDKSQTSYSVTINVERSLVPAAGPNDMFLGDFSLDHSAERDRAGRSRSFEGSCPDDQAEGATAWRNRALLMVKGRGFRLPKHLQFTWNPWAVLAKGVWAARTDAERLHLRNAHKVLDKGYSVHLGDSCCTNGMRRDCLVRRHRCSLDQPCPLSRQESSDQTTTEPLPYCDAEGGVPRSPKHRVPTRSADVCCVSSSSSENRPSSSDREFRFRTINLMVMHYSTQARTHCQAVMDTGAQVSLISERTARRFGVTRKDLQSPVMLHPIGGQSFTSLGRIKINVHLNCEKGWRLVEFHVVRDKEMGKRDALLSVKLTMDLNHLVRVKCPLCDDK